MYNIYNQHTNNRMDFLFMFKRKETPPSKWNVLDTQLAFGLTIKLWQQVIFLKIESS